MQCDLSNKLEEKRMTEEEWTEEERLEWMRLQTIEVHRNLAHIYGKPVKDFCEHDEDC